MERSLSPTIFSPLLLSSWPSSRFVGAINEQLYRLGDRASLSADLIGVQFGDFWGREEPYRTHPHYERKELSRTPAI